MLPQRQTEFGDTGNCLAACVATLLEIPLSTVPNFMRQPNWYNAFSRWLWERGYAIVSVNSFHREPVIAIGQSPRGRAHAVIYQYGRLIFDPHPDNTGIRAVDNAYLLYRVR